MRGGDGMKALRHQHDIAILDRKTFVERTIIRINALEAEALWRV